MTTEKRLRRIVGGAAVVIALVAMTTAMAWSSPARPTADSGAGVQISTLRGLAVASALDCPAVGTCYASGNPAGRFATTAEYTKAAATKGMLVTHDGGRSWHLGGPDLAGTLSCPSADVCAGTMPFFDAAGTMQDGFWETVDGGSTWSRKLMPGTTDGTLSCVSASSCVTTGTRGQILVTSDGGTVWKATNLPQGLGGFGAFALQCLAGGRCIAVGELSTSSQGDGPTAAIYSTDGGGSWMRGSFPPASLDRADLSCGTPMDCMTVRNSGYTAGGAVALAPLVTQDGGATWHLATNPKGIDYTGAEPGVDCFGPSECSFDANSVTGVGPSATADIGRFVTTDLGRTWQPLSTPASVGTGLTKAPSCPSTTACYTVAVPAPTPKDEGNGGPSDFLTWDPSTSTGI